MKTNLLKSAVLVASLFGALSTASAETLHAHIPFASSAAGTSMPAGNYAISTMPHAPQVLVFENEETKMQAIVFARTASGLPAKPAPPLTFTAYSSDSMELANIAASSFAYELSTHSAQKPLKGVALTLTSGGK
jgi:hypothetical protein